METPEPPLTTRPARESDRAFACEVKRAAPGPYVAQVWGWDEVEQQAFFAGTWRARRPDIVVLEGEDVGTVQFVRRERDYLLGEFYLLPEHHRRGIGSRLLRRMLARADADGVPVCRRIVPRFTRTANQTYLSNGCCFCGALQRERFVRRMALGLGSGNAMPLPTFQRTIGLPEGLSKKPGTWRFQGDPGRDVH